MENKQGVIYILTNPSFPEYVKIGYADDLQTRVNQLNNSEAIPFAFRVYAYYKVNQRLGDLKVHNIIDKLNPNLRSIDHINGKERKREFYAMSKEDAYEILEAIAEINGTAENLVIVNPTKKEIDDEKEAKEIETLVINRHHFRNVEFSSSLTKKDYLGKTGEDGTLCIIEKDSGIVIPNNSNPSKKAIVKQALADLGIETKREDTLYQLYHKLTKTILG